MVRGSTGEDGNGFSGMGLAVLVDEVSVMWIGARLEGTLYRDFDRFCRSLGVFEFERRLPL